MKSRGMAHTSEVRMFKISSKGIILMPISNSDKKTTPSESKRRIKEHQNLSTSKGSSGLKESAR
jgi:hypothetical protein